MVYFPIIQKSRGAYFAAHHKDLPPFYMGDFSILGFQVSDCERAIRILERHHFSLVRFQEATKVGVEGPLHLHEAVQLLKGSGLTCEIADVVDGMYQG